MENCLFCKIIKGEIPSDKVYEDGECYAFRDINPQAPVHVLVVPKKHIGNLLGFEEQDQALAGHLQLVIAKIARQEGIAESGFCVIHNCGRDAMQTVQHAHFHILGGKPMAEKMV